MLTSGGFEGAGFSTLDVENPKPVLAGVRDLENRLSLKSVSCSYCSYMKMPLTRTTTTAGQTAGSPRVRSEESPGRPLRQQGKIRKNPLRLPDDVLDEVLEHVFRSYLRVTMGRLDPRGKFR